MVMTASMRCSWFGSRSNRCSSTTICTQKVEGFIIKIGVVNISHKCKQICWSWFWFCASALNFHLAHHVCTSWLIHGMLLMFFSPGTPAFLYPWAMALDAAHYIFKIQTDFLTLYKASIFNTYITIFNNVNNLFWRPVTHTWTCIGVWDRRRI